MGLGSFVKGIVGSVTGGDILSAGSSLLGGILGDKSTESANNQNAAIQREFAQNGIRWKVEDAKAAGIHPLYALGANTTSFSPSYVGSSLPQSLAEAGQNLGRAMNATRTENERAVANLELENRALQNDLLRAQIGSITAVNRQAGGNPPMPSTSDAIEVRPDQVTSSRKGDMSTSAAYPKPAVTEFMNRDGSVSVWPSPDAKNAVEDSWYEYEHMWKNRIRPSLREHGNSIKRAWRDVWWNPRNF